MKHEIDVERPANLKEAWPRQYGMFSWLEYVVNIPYPVFLVTTFNENGKPNACLHSWGCFAGDDRGFCSVLVVLKTFHTYDNILRSGEWCINLPSADQQEQCMKTIEYNGLESDEIVEAGFTVGTAQVVRAPRIAECLINLECKLEWDRSLFEGSEWHIFAGRVVHLAMDSAAFELDPQQRMQTLRTMYSMRASLNPLTGEAGPSSLPIIGV